MATTQHYAFEIYLRGPRGERGWTIRTGWLRAVSREDARAWLAALPSFDSIVACDHANPNPGDVSEYTARTDAARDVECGGPLTY